MLVRAVGTNTDHGEHPELSAFLVIAWYTYRNKAALKFSALVRTIASEATMYFLVMVAVQTYIQMSLSLMKVQSLSIYLSLCPAPLRDNQSDRFRVLINNYRFCEYAICLNDKGPRLTASASRIKCIWTVCLLSQSIVTDSKSHLFPASLPSWP